MSMRKPQSRKVTTTEPLADRMVTNWAAHRQLAVEIEREVHPDITDRYGRVWVWRRGDVPDDLYAHDGMARSSDMISDAGPPGPLILHNPNYTLCAICLHLAARTHRFLHHRQHDVEWSSPAAVWGDR